VERHVPVPRHSHDSDPRQLLPTSQSSQAKSSQAHSSQAHSSQAKSSQAKSTQAGRRRGAGAGAVGVRALALGVRVGRSALLLVLARRVAAAVHAPAVRGLEDGALPLEHRARRAARPAQPKYPEHGLHTALALTLFFAGGLISEGSYFFLGPRPQEISGGSRRVFRTSSYFAPPLISCEARAFAQSTSGISWGILLWRVCLHASGQLWSERRHGDPQWWPHAWRRR
jgi:hypothetical protein